MFCLELCIFLYYSFKSQLNSIVSTTNNKNLIVLIPSFQGCLSLLNKQHPRKPLGEWHRRSLELALENQGEVFSARAVPPAHVSAAGAGGLMCTHTASPWLRFAFSVLQHKSLFLLLTPSTNPGVQLCKVCSFSFFFFKPQFYIKICKVLLCFDALPDFVVLQPSFLERVLKKNITCLVFFPLPYCCVTNFETKQN